MHPLLSMNSMMPRYLLGDLALDESQQIEEAMPQDYNLRREIEAAKEELVAAYVLGWLRDIDRLKFETAFSDSEEVKGKIKFATAWVETGGTIYPDLSSPLHRYVIGDLPSDEIVEVEEKLHSDENYRQRLEAAEDEVLIAYFHNTLSGHERELFDTHYLSNDRIIVKLRFAHIICVYERNSLAPSSTPENAVGASSQPLRMRSETISAGSRI